MRRPRARFPVLSTRLFAALDEVDPAADRCVEALASDRDQAERWLAEDTTGRDPEDAPPAVRDFFATARQVPAWVDWSRVDRAGRLFFRSGPAGGLTLGAKSLVGGYCSPGGNKPLAFSGALEGQISRRLAETGRFVVATNTEGALHPGGEAWGVTLRVRLMHAQVRRLLWRSGRWDRDRWGEPINQHDMVATSLLFSAVFLLGLREFGVPITSAEADDYMHLWRLSGWLMGVREDLLPTNEAEGLRLAELIALTQGEPDEDGRRLVRALLDSPRGTLRSGGASGRLETWQIQLGEGYCRGLIGDSLADSLGLPKDGWRFALPITRAAVTLGRHVLPRRLRDPLRWETLGHRYWARNVEVGLGGTPAQFALPAGLRGRRAAATPPISY